MVAKPSELKGWSLQWGAVPGTFFLAPPRRRMSYAEWVAEWVEVDTSETLAQVGLHSTSTRPVPGLEANQIERLIEAIDHHPVALSSGRLEIFLHLKEKYTRTKTLTGNDLHFLLEVLRGLNNEQHHDDDD